jgi:predicted PurR-regulated permease PerM
MAAKPTASVPLPLAEGAMIGLFIMALFTMLHLMAALLVPMVAAVVIGSVLTHLGDRLAPRGAPPLLIGLVLVVVASLGGFVLVSALLDPFVSIVAQVPKMLEALLKAVAPLMEPFSVLRKALLNLDGEAAPQPVAVSGDTSWLTRFLSGLTPALGEFFVFFATLAFFIAGRVSLRRRLILAWTTHDSRLAVIRILNAIEEALAAYFAVTASIYLGVGVATALIAALTGLANPLLWGVLAFTASFIPYFGAGLVTLALAAGGLTAHSQLIWALLPAGAFLTVHAITENAVIPALLGRRLEINPFVVFVAIVFWGWLWGPVGTMLAVPLLLIVETVISTVRQDRRVLPE